MPFSSYCNGAGECNWTASAQGSGARKTGTSYAVPFVSAAGVLLASRPELDMTIVRARLEESTLDLGQPGRDATFGFGLIQMAGLCSGPAEPLRRSRQLRGATPCSASRGAGGWKPVTLPVNARLGAVANRAFIRPPPRLVRTSAGTVATRSAGYRLEHRTRRWTHFRDTSDAPSLGWRIVGCDPKGHVSENRGQLSVWCASDLRCRGAIVMVSLNCIFGRKRRRPYLGANGRRGGQP